MADTDRYEIPWDESLNTGIHWIDEQHKQLLKCIEDMLNALIEKKCQENVKSLVTFLSDYVRTHFNTEQSYMIRYNYPNFLIHKIQHKDFFKKMKEIERQYALHGSSRELAMEIEKELWGWYKTHICKFDKNFSTFLQDIRASDYRD
ncbi:MAG TPA: bacteriohemerythrin [archaeon]|nr:bacteriohemerythrin [archaeon]